MIIKEINSKWYIVKGRGLAFFGSDKNEVMTRATKYLSGKGGE